MIEYRLEPENNIAKTMVTKGVIRIRNPKKNRHLNDQAKKDKKDQQRSTKHWTEN